MKITLRNQIRPPSPFLFSNYLLAKHRIINKSMKAHERVGLRKKKINHHHRRSLSLSLSLSPLSLSPCVYILLADLPRVSTYESAIHYTLN